MIGVGQAAGAFVLAIADIERGADSLTALQKAQLLATTGTGYLQALAEIGKAEREMGLDRRRSGDITLETAKATETYTAQLAAAKAEVAALSAAQRTQLNAALALGGDAAKAYAESIDLSDAALGFYQDGQRDAAASTKTHTAEMRRQAAAAEALATRFKESVKVFNVFDNLGTTFRAPIESAGEAAATLGASLSDLPSDAGLALSTFAQFAPTLKDASEEIADIRAEAWTIGKGFEQAFGEHRQAAARRPDGRLPGRRQRRQEPRRSGRRRVRRVVREAGRRPALEGDRQDARRGAWLAAARPRHGARRSGRRLGR